MSKSRSVSKRADSSMPTKYLDLALAFSLAIALAPAFAFAFAVVSSPSQSSTAPAPVQEAKDAPQAVTQGRYEFQDSVVVQQTVDEVMARPEFQFLREKDREERKNAAWLDRLLDWLEAVLTRDTDRSARDSPVGVEIVYALALLIVLGILAFIVKAIFDSANARELEENKEQARIARAGAAPGETHPDEYWALAQALAAAGNEKLALRELLLGAMSALERRGLIRHRRGLTNRDYYWAAAAASDNAHKSIKILIAAFEEVYFGRREVTTTVFRECSRAYHQSFHTSVWGDAALTHVSRDERG